MLAMLLRRLGLGAITVWLVSIIIFVGVEMLPGDTCTAFLEREAQGKLLENCREDLGLNRSALVRYADWAGSAVRGDLGVSANGQKQISELVGYRLRNTLLLASGAMLVGIPLALFLGVVAALWRDKLVDIVVSTTAIFAMTIPEFVSATLLILVFSVWLGWVPGIVLTSADAPLIEFFPEVLLPIAVLTLVMTAHILRTVRSSVIETLASDYAQMATLKGVPYWQIVFRHILPNALLPTINVVALTIAWLLGGVVVIETVFNYPGLGRMMIDSISDRDLPVTQAIALIIASVYVVVNLAADILTMLANPRLRTVHMRKG
ncbi:peptide/nickel transport system permease protein [Sulfitobacter brevis]|uniref:Peptide/nickel transport system permease protein n=1 Tax=Sulfitobacter brevis TaxID=74348 RepID=A0A1I2GSJ2_9RHOB|nr:ABC transporter permease [Sulfitobacter brevis]SFF20904.1 peptide/nickel transport system permease protein [Sulfitobacter brevis]